MPTSLGQLISSSGQPTTSAGVAMCGACCIVAHFSLALPMPCGCGSHLEHRPLCLERCQTERRTWYGSGGTADAYPISAEVWSAAAALGATALRCMQICVVRFPQACSMTKYMWNRAPGVVWSRRHGRCMPDMRRLPCRRRAGVAETLNISVCLA